MNRQVRAYEASTEVRDAIANKRCAAGLYVAAVELAEAVGDGNKRKIQRMQQRLRKEADEFAKQGGKR